MSSLKSLVRYWAEAVKGGRLFLRGELIRSGHITGERGKAALAPLFREVVLNTHAE